MRTVISTKNAPLAVGSYSQAVKCGELLFLSGQICKNPETGELENQSIISETTQIMENIKNIVLEAGATMDDVIKCNAFLSDMKYFDDFESVYKTYFNAPYPARITVASAGIYANLNVEMDAIVKIK